MRSSYVHRPSGQHEMKRRKVVAFIVFVYGLFAQLETGGTAAPDSGSGIP